MSSALKILLLPECCHRTRKKKGEKHSVKRYLCPVFTAALFTTAKTWKQTKCPLTEEWTKKVWYIYHGILLSHEKNETMPSATTRMDLEVTTLS